MVQWTHVEKHTFLWQRVLIKGVRRLDDKLLFVDIDLLESKLHFSLKNLPKARASLMAARTAANAIYVPPAQQGTIDLQTFEAFNALEDPRAVFSLKYMLLCKIMVDQVDDVAGIIYHLKLDCSICGCCPFEVLFEALKLFETCLRDIRAQQEEDPIVHRHLSSLLIEPFSRVEIAHIAELIELPVDHVEKKLSQIILDKKFAGTLHQVTDAIYPATLETISNIGKVVDSLYVMSAKIMA
ncbi:26S proteasome non-ATPase regulatory subunit 11 homolog [Fagus crenata]